jgi:hypothetical protein
MKGILVGVLVALALLVTGCGQETGSPAATPAESTKKASPEPPVSSQRPPDVVLVSEAGRQAGVVGSYCVDNPAAGLGVCADGTRPQAQQANVVRPGETIAIALDRAQAVKAAGCHARDASCIGEARVAPLGCKSATVARIFLERGPETRWRANLRPGAYELEVFVYFEGDDGRTGDVSVALGLLVDADAEQTIIPMPAAAAVCP